MDKILPVSKAAAAAVPPLNESASAYVVPSQTALGGRSVEVLPNYDFIRLRLGCQNPNVLPNGSMSTGASPVLRELLHQSGVVYQVSRELFNDGDPQAHQGGNALDVSSPHPIAIAAILRAAPELVHAFAYQSLFPAESLFIWNGALTTSAALAGLIDATGATMHLSSSLGRLAAALAKATVQNAMTAAATGQFANRDVFALDTPVPVSLTSVTSRKPVHFW